MRRRVEPARRELSPGSTRNGLGWYLGQYEDAVREHPAESAADARARSVNLVNVYYDLAAEFYERGWGESFHFAAPPARERYADAMRRHERLVAGRLRVNALSSILDIGCGIGGPTRHIATATASRVTGLNISRSHIA